MAEVKVGHIIFHNLKARNIDGARDEILNLLERTSNGATIYFDGWDGLGKASVLRSMAQVLHSMQDPHPKLCFGRIIYIDCSTWESKRVIQRRIADELKLDSKTMAMFKKQDDEDDFNGVDLTSRDAIRDVAAVIHQTLRESSFMMIFLNGSDEEVVLSKLGVPEFDECVIIWTFKKGFWTKGLVHDRSYTAAKEIASKLRSTNIFLGSFGYIPSSRNVSALVHAEAASILTHHPYMRDDDRAVVIDCYLYVLFMLHSFHEGTSRLWAAHGTNYWICDGIIQGGRTRDICKALCQEVSFDSLLHLNPSYVVDDDHYQLWKGENRPRHWISITSKNMIFRENMKNILAMASSIFLTFEITKSPQGLPDDLMEQCNNLRVLILFNCAFNFLSPLFGHCSTLRFLGLDHCINNYTTELVAREDNTANWACLRSLWVLDLRHTDWVEILSEESMDLMGSIMELNIEGSMCWQYTAAKLEGRLPYLERLRIVKPWCEAEASMEIDSSFVGKTKLQVLDLSGNEELEKLPTSLSEASSLEVLVLDGCDGLRNVVLSNSKLRSFSFDGYGPASNWTSMHELPLESSRQKYDTKKDVKTSLTTLKVTSTQLKILFLRGLPNLVELDLSGCAIKILDLETMVVDVPRLKRLLLIGCEHLCSIRWGPTIDITSVNETRMTVNLELLCIDTRPSDGVPGRTRPFIAQPNNFGLQVHAVTADARLVRSLWPPIHHHAGKDVFFDIRITSSSISCDDDVSTEVGGSSMTPVQAFPQPPSSRLDHHIEVGDGSQSVGSEVEVRYAPNLGHLMNLYVQSLHVHDTSTSTAMPQGEFSSLKLCRVERCPRLDHVFPPEADPYRLETIWVSDLLMARCILSKSRLDNNNNIEFKGLQHLHLRSCPRLEFALPVRTTSFPMLETIHIIHCGSLTHVFALDNMESNILSSVYFPELTTIHLHDVPALRQICEVKMFAPKLETIRTRGCWNLRQLPAVLKLVEGTWRWSMPVVEMEKDVWGQLVWDGVKGYHHPAFYQPPLHSRHYKRHLLRGTVLR